MNPFCIYFPQFYPIPTNDAAWGRGFTDWALVANANLHARWSRRAPRRGFYDGSDPAVHAAQIEEMRSFGLGGFGLYHYWFFSHQELGKFEQTLLDMGQNSSMPWFLIWATEGWSRRWLGDPAPLVTLSRDPSDADIAAHCDHLARCFEHPSYLRLGGRPVFVWYHLAHFERPEDVVSRYRTALARRGVEPTMGHFVKNPFDVRHASVVDFTYLFEPRLFFGTLRAGRGEGTKRWFDRVEKVIGERATARILIMADRLQQAGTTHSAQAFLDYLGSAERRALVASIPGVVQEVLSPGWNNTPRYADRFTALEDVAPERFGALVRQASHQAGVPPLINAWNEWSEGAAIEPCAYLGTAYVDAVASASSASISTSEDGTALSRESQRAA